MPWTTLLIGALMAATAGSGETPDESIEVRVRGTLRGGLMAIGGETTGYLIRARGLAWELDFGGDPAFVAKADSLDGKAVVVTGTLEVRPGVEVKTRSIVKVQTLEAASPSASPAAAKPKAK